jgi:hypothetical protein
MQINQPVDGLQVKWNESGEFWRIQILIGNLPTAA